MKCPIESADKNRTGGIAPANALDELLKAIWEWTFADYLATSPVDRKDDLFHSIVSLDSALHGLTVEEGWERIEAWQHGQQQE